MTPARSLAAGMVALGVASTLTAPTPASAAPTPCEGAENYAAQAGAEALHVNRLVSSPMRNADPAERKTTTGADGAEADGTAAARRAPGSTCLLYTSDAADE